ncbi:hypothetical protein NDU88_003751 [Pleurodeles waltl]|uniref:Uncharacterized protein n=1 Tax=Pleurodeles waltl TaxID=8319 RepID=A0AAV7MRI0_PLEWA|nr:hypothetical protein NDU88_003751 [Pleurodeles waltl]
MESPPVRAGTPRIKRGPARIKAEEDPVHLHPSTHSLERASQPPQRLTEETVNEEVKYYKVENVPCSPSGMPEVKGSEEQTRLAKNGSIVLFGEREAGKEEGRNRKVYRSSVT